MQCPNCGATAEPGTAFCGACGAQMPAEVAPTQPLPQAPVPPPLPRAAEPVSTPEPAAAPPAVEPPPMPVGAAPQYQQPPTQQPAYAPQQTYAAQQPAYGQPQPPVKKKTGCIIAVVAVVLVALIGGCVTVFLVLRPFKQEITGVVSMPTDVTTDVAPAVSGFDTAEAALESVLESGWVYKATRTTDERVTFWTGPPNSEYVDEVVVEKGADGSWTVTDQSTIGGGDVPMTAEDEAKLVLSEFLDDIQADKADEAHKLTVEPFSYDAASAAYSNGEFLSYEILETEAQADGTFWIHVREVWKNSTDNWGYYLVPTEAGYRISDLKPW